MLLFEGIISAMTMAIMGTMMTTMTMAVTMSMITMMMSMEEVLIEEGRMDDLAGMRSPDEDAEC